MSFLTLFFSDFYNYLFPTLINNCFFILKIYKRKKILIKFKTPLYSWDSSEWGLLSVVRVSWEILHLSHGSFDVLEWYHGIITLLWLKPSHGHNSLASDWFTEVLDGLRVQFKFSQLKRKTFMQKTPKLL